MSQQTADGPVAVLEGLGRDDCFRVDSHDRPLRVHNAGEFVGNVILVAYDKTGAQWTVNVDDGQLYLGRMDSRRKPIQSVDVLADGGHE